MTEQNTARKVFDFDYETTRFNKIKEIFNKFSDEPVEFVEALNKEKFGEWEIFRELCQRYSYNQLKNFQVIIDKIEDHTAYENKERVEMVFDPPEIQSTPSDTLEDLIERRYRYSDVINFIKDRFSYNDLLSDLCGNLCSEDAMMIRHLLSNGKGDK